MDKFICSHCKRVSAFVESDGKCGAPGCRQEELETQIDQLALENRELEQRLTNLENQNGV